MPTHVRSYSKINLGLAVGPVRADGFHGLTTLYQTLALHDRVTVTAAPSPATRITLVCDRDGQPARGVPQTRTGDAGRNTAFRIVEAALLRLGRTAEVDIHIDKRLPVQGGMGAGSANAAAAMIALEHELNESLPAAERLALAAGIGSDVPLFLLGGTVLGLGRGEQVYPLPDLPATPCVIAVPNVGVSTALAFRALDLRMNASTAAAPALTEKPVVDKLEELSRVLAGAFTVSGRSSGPTGIVRNARSNTGSNTLPKPSNGTAADLAETQSSQQARLMGWENTLLALVRTGIENDFEEVAFSQHPSLRDHKRQLMGSDSDGPALYAGLSGSGSALFGLYRSPEDAAAAQQRVQSAGVQAILTETLPRAAYWERMFAE